MSCPAHRNIKGNTREGLFLEQLEVNPGRFIPERLRRAGEGGIIKCLSNLTKKRKEWELVNVTPEEIASILQIGKETIVNGIGHRYYTSSLKDLLIKLKREDCFES